MDTPLRNVPVTVLMPVFNGQSFLREAIDSIFAQSLQEFEFLIINDGSTDNTASILASYDDTRINVVNNETNIGLIATLNKGIEMARGSFIARMDADDVSSPRRLERQLEFMVRNPSADIVGTWFHIADSNEVIKHPVSPDACKVEALFGTILGHPTVMFRKSSLTRAGLSYSPSAIHAEDYQLWVDAMVEGLSIHNIPDALLTYRLHSGQVSAENAAIQLASVGRIRRSYWLRSFPASAAGKEDIIDEMLAGKPGNAEKYRQIKSLCTAVLAENSRSGQMDSRLLSRFLHRMIVRAARQLYDAHGAGKLQYGMFDPYFYRHLFMSFFKETSDGK